MTQLEIATRILCSGKANTPDESWILAGELIVLDKEINHNREDYTAPIMESIEALEYLEQRTEKRTQQVIDLGFEYNEEHASFDRGIDMVTFIAIETYDDDDWERTIAGFEGSLSLEEELEPIEELHSIESKEAITDIFNGKTYIEFPMDKSILRLFKIEDRVQAEDDLQITKKSDSKFIIAYSDNEEHQLGITIFKK